MSERRHKAITFIGELTMSRVTIALLLLSISGLASQASAAVVIGGSTLFGGGDANQLESGSVKGPLP